ncbi:MAG TPA: ABC transporter permease [Chthoniobacterales bacterium]
MRSLISHLRYTIRLLLKSPGFSIATVLIMGLAIGANTAIFSLIDAVLLESLPYPEPEKLFTIVETSPAYPKMSVAYPDYLDWRVNQHSFEDLAVFRRDNFNLTGNGDPAWVHGAFVTASYFRVLGAQPARGRALSENDDHPGGAGVVLLSDRFWRNRFAADPRVIGQNLVLNDVSYEIIGVVPPQIVTPEDMDVYLPFSHFENKPALTDRGTHPGLFCLARLKQGASLESASAELRVIARNLELQYPDTNSGISTQVTPLLEDAVGQYRMTLYLLVAVVGLVLLIGCANVANLLLGRAIARQREVALRAALGASRGRLVSQLLFESVVLAAFGGLLGLLLAQTSLEAIRALAPHDVARFRQVHINSMVLLFTTLVTLGSGLIFGLWPALKTSRINIRTTLESAGGHGSTAGAARQRSQSLLVIGQVALASLLLVGATLLIQSFQSLQRVPLGFDPHHLLTVGIKLPKSKYQNESDQSPKTEEMAAFYGSLLERIRRIPGIEAFALGSNTPFNGNNFSTDFGIVGQPIPRPGEEPTAEFESVSPDYFKTLRIQIVRGRDFDAEDRIGKTPVVIIDEKLANRCFPGQDPIGQQIIEDPHKPNSSKYTIIGVVRTVRHNDLVNVPKLAELYYPISQKPELGMTILLRAKGDPLQLVSATREAVQSLDPNLPVFNIRTLETQLSNELVTQRLSVILVGLFSVLALLLAAVGLYGVLAYSTAQRTREIGIRIALGAESGSILSLVVRQGLTIVGIGLVAGIISSIILTHLIQSLLYGVSGTDPVALLTAVCVLTLAAFLACLVPALRAIRVDPITALRE